MKITVTYTYSSHNKEEFPHIKKDIFDNIAFTTTFFVGKNIVQNKFSFRTIST